MMFETICKTIESNQRTLRESFELYNPNYGAPVMRFLAKPTRLQIAKALRDYLAADAFTYSVAS